MNFTPAEELWESQSQPPESIVSPGLLSKSGILVVTGEEETELQRLVLQIAHEIASGSKVLGLFPTVQSKVIYIITDSSSDGIRSLMRAGKKWQGTYSAADGNLFFSEGRIPLLDSSIGFEEMRFHIGDSKADVVVVDWLPYMMKKSYSRVNQKRAISNCQKLSHEFNCSFILVQPSIERKMVFDRQTGVRTLEPLTLDHISGSKYIQYEAETILGLTGTGVNREVVFLKHSLSPAKYADNDPLPFHYDAVSATPFKPDQGAVAMVMRYQSDAPQWPRDHLK